jgi:hypothetical protein
LHEPTRQAGLLFAQHGLAADEIAEAALGLSSLTAKPRPASSTWSVEAMSWP